MGGGDIGGGSWGKEGPWGVAEGDKGYPRRNRASGREKGPWVEGASLQGKEGGSQSRERT